MTPMPTTPTRSRTSAPLLADCTIERSPPRISSRLSLARRHAAGDGAGYGHGHVLIQRVTAVAKQVAAQPLEPARQSIRSDGEPWDGLLAPEERARRTCRLGPER